MQDDDFDGGMEMPDDDELAGEPRETDLGDDLSGAGDLEADATDDEPSHRGAAVARPRSSSGSRKPAAKASAPKKAAKKAVKKPAVKKPAAKKKVAKKAAKKSAKKGAKKGARKSAKKAARKVGRGKK